MDSFKFIFLILLGCIFSCTYFQNENRNFKLNPKTLIEFRLVANQGDLSCQKIASIEPNHEECLETKVWINEADIRDGYVISEVDKEDFGVVLNLNPKGTNNLRDVTRYNVKRKLAIVINNKVYYAPIIMMELDGPSFQISFGYANTHLKREFLETIFQVPDFSYSIF